MVELNFFCYWTQSVFVTNDWWSIIIDFKKITVH